MGVVKSVRLNLCCVLVKKAVFKNEERNKGIFFQNGFLIIIITVNITLITSFRQSICVHFLIDIYDLLT